MIRVLLAEDSAILRDTLVSVLDLEDDLVVVADVATGDEILPAARLHLPDVAVLDIDLPGVDGLTAAGRLAVELPACGVLILTAYARPSNLRAALDARVSGFLAKDTSARRLIAAIRTVAEGGRVVDPDIAIAAIQARPSPLSARARPRCSACTPRASIPATSRAPSSCPTARSATISPPRPTSSARATAPTPSTSPVGRAGSSTC